MKVMLVAVASTLSANGFRKIAAIVRTMADDDLQVAFIPVGTEYNVFNILFKNGDHNTRAFALREIQEIASKLAEADVVGFSAMTEEAELTKSIIQEIKNINPNSFTVWGGAHAILAPGDAIRAADAVCTSEGDITFPELLDRLRNGQPYADVQNFWFKDGDAIIKNGFRPLLTSEEMEALPPPYYETTEAIYKPGRGFVSLTVSDWLRFHGLSYNTLWTIGCPFKCTYCGNSRLVEIDKNYRKIRHPSVAHLIQEVQHAVRIHPHISTVVFNDDSFLALPKTILEAFAEAWRKEVAIPFAMVGITPHYVDREKLAILLKAGMNRLRMGIQSGSDRILKFFQRPNKPGLIQQGAKVIGECSPYILPPCYDIIVDTPIENRDDVVATLRLIHGLPRPFTLNVYSLRVIPNTDLEKQIAELGMDVTGIGTTYYSVAPTFANALLFLIAAVPLPRKLFEYLLKYVKPVGEEQPSFHTFLFFSRMIFFIMRGFSHLRFMDFSVIPGRIGWVLWRVGFIRFWRRHFVKRFPGS